MNPIDKDHFAGGAGIDQASRKGSEKHLAQLLNELPDIIEKEIDEDATGGLTIYDANAPCGFEILDVKVQARVTSSSGSVKLTDGTNDITDAIACDTDKVIARAGTIDDDYSTIAKNGSLKVVTNGSADRGLVTISVKKT